MITDTTRVLAPENTRRLIDFARAFKAAARAVVLYPPTHPAISATLGRIVAITSAGQLATPLRVGVLPDSLLLDGLAPGRPDAAIGELAVLLHDHLVGELTVHPGGDVEAWRRFLTLVGRTPDEVRTEGGIAQVWGGMAGSHVELRQIDYAEVLRERETTDAATWSDIVAHCLSDYRPVGDERSRRLLSNAASDHETLEKMVAAVDRAAIDAGHDAAGRAATFVCLLDHVANTVTDGRLAQSDSVIEHLAAALARLSPDLQMSVLSQPTHGIETPGLIHSLFEHLSAAAKARFVAHHAMAGGPATERLAQVFRTLVPEEQRDRLLAVARVEASSAAADLNGFDEQWEAVAQTLLTLYSDKSFVSDDYGRELTGTRETAIDVERVSDDPLERLHAWLGSVTASEVRRLDLALVHDLLRIERDADTWASLMGPLVALIDDLMLVGDFEAADRLIRVLVGERLNATIHHQAAAGAINALVTGSLVRLVAGHLETAEEASYECVKETFLVLGDSMITPLTGALLEEIPPRTRERLERILIAFGVAGRSEIHRLKNSSSAVVRRTAIELLRQVGGSQALSELSEFLDDHEVVVQRKAVRAILTIATDQAYAVLGRALAHGKSTQREIMLNAVDASRVERSAPLYAYILRHFDHRGRLVDLYARAINALGTLKAPQGIAPLSEALYRGEWWAPRRTTTLRNASAAALARIGTRDALGVLEAAAATGTRGVRAAARTHLATAAGRPGERDRR